MKDHETHTDILIVGAGMGGVAAALAALRLGRSVLLTEETDWIGGQLTAQGVPPDESPWIDTYRTGATQSYRALRKEIRSYYRRYYPLLDAHRKDPRLNPGMGSVSPITHEPKIALAVLMGMLSPFLASGRLRLWLNHQPIKADLSGDRVEAITLLDTCSGQERIVHCNTVLDATELGDLLPLAEVEHVIGAESQAQTAEMHALSGEPDPMDQQALSWCFALDYFLGEDHTIEEPEDYKFWRSYQADFWPGPHLGWCTPEPTDLRTVCRPIFDGPTDAAFLEDMWHFRRILYRKYYPKDFFPSDITLVNWPQIDYWLGPILGVSDEEAQKHLRSAQQLSLAFLYWMQTEAPRHDGGQGYPGLRLRGDILGTDGLAKAPYVREARRIQARFTVLEEHVGVEQRGDLQGAELFPDTVGIGSYRIDLHPSTAGRNYVDIPSWPFQIPLGALLPIRVKNLLPAGKNIGTTHITNGCYRLHPVEWNIGEAAGALAAQSLNLDLAPQQIYENAARLKDFQNLLSDKLGFELHWPEELRLTPRVKLDPLGI
jgi:hypothetical protein